MIYGLLLAAGTSSRMGQPKQLLNWQGQPLLRYVVRQAHASRLDGLVVVVGAAADAMRAALANEPGLTLVENPEYASGQASSLRVGLAALPAQVEAVVVLLVDQPLISPALINQLIDAFRSTTAGNERPLAVIPRYQSQRGNPVLLSQLLFAELQTLQGDAGARGVLQRYANRIAWLDTDDPAVITDIDTPEAYAALLGQQKTAGS